VHVVAPFNANIFFFQTQASDFKVTFPLGETANNQIGISITDEVGNYIKLQSDFQMVWRLRKFRQADTKDQILLKNLTQLMAVQLAQSQKK
jgi:hypothetical protein